MSPRRRRSRLWRWFSGLFERVEGDERRYEYRFIKAGSPKDLRKKIEQEHDASFGLVAVAVGDDAAAIYEAGVAGGDVTLAMGNGGDLQKELNPGPGKSFCVVDSDGRSEAVYVVRHCPEVAPWSAYEVIATTKTETFERELNAAAVRGLQFVPDSLIAIQKRVALMGTYNYEAVGLVAGTGDATTRTYRVLGTTRASTFDKELTAAAQEGFGWSGSPPATRKWWPCW